MKNVQEKFQFLIKSLYDDEENCIALDINDCLQFIGANRLIDFGADHADLILGKNFQDIINIKYDAEKNLFLENMLRMKHKCLKTRQSLTALVSASFNHIKILHLIRLRSVFDENKNIVGCIINAKDFSLSTNNNNSIKTVKLTHYQEEIMFLLAIGFSQKEIADIYNVQRGTIIKTIGTICAKFHFSGASSDTLINLVYNDGYGLPPYHLLNTGIFQINTNFITKDIFRRILIEK